MAHNSIQEMRQILAAIEQGKKIQYQMANPDDPEKWCGYAGNTPNFFAFRYRVKPEIKETRLTNRELAKWLAQGNGELRTTDSETSRTKLGYKLAEENWQCRENYRIRKWTDTEWHKPTREYAFGEVKNEA